MAVQVRNQYVNARVKAIDFCNDILCCNSYFTVVNVMQTCW